jgi:hypothetical protein
MSTFVLRFAGDPTLGCRGRIHHVGTGEETTFTNLGELLAFLAQMNALVPQGWDEETGEADPPTSDPARRPPARI